MNVTLELWQVITLLLAILGGFWTLAKILAGQVSRNIDEKFQAVATAQETTTVQLEDHRAKLVELEKDLLKLMGTLPLEYVRREDFIRNQTTIEAKLDGVAHSLQQLAMQRKP